MSKVIYVSGTFDLLHSNHIRMIEYGRGLGSTLIVGVSTDELVCTYKKPPAIPFEERMEVLKALSSPDIVVPQHSLDHSVLVKDLNIDAFVIGDDWRGKYDYLKALGVKVFYFPYGKGISSSNLKEKIHEDYQLRLSESDGHSNPNPK